MGEANPRLDRFFERDEPWKPVLQALRAVVLEGPVEEDLRWRQPCYRAHDGNIAIIGGMGGRVFLSFLKGALLSDPKHVLIAPGENSRSARMIKFDSVDEVEAQAKVILDYLREAVENEKAGRKIAFAKDDLDWPPELEAALDKDPKLREAFDALTPGRRRSWLLHFRQPKQAKTVEARITKAAPKILVGQGLNDR